MFSYPAGENLKCAYPTIKETIPRSSLGYTTNNVYVGFPPLMADGRAVSAAWQPEAVSNQELLKKENITSNWQYRNYLTKHSKEIMQHNFREASNDMGYYKRNNNSSINNVASPYQYKSALDNTQPFGYHDSDLKQMYLSREQLELRKVSPVMTQEELLQRQSTYGKI